MNDEIVKTQNEIIKCDNLKYELRKKLEQQYYDYLKTIGIEIGTIVKSTSTKNNNTGIFTRLVFEFDKIKPVIMKIKKDGTPHAFATVYCYKLDEMEKAK